MVFHWHKYTLTHSCLLHLWERRCWMNVCMCVCLCLCGDPFAFISPTQCALCEWMCACSWINPLRAAGTVSKPGHREMAHELNYTLTIRVSSRFWSVLLHVILCDGSAALHRFVLRLLYSVGVCYWSVTVTEIAHYCMAFQFTLLVFQILLLSNAF